MKQESTTFWQNLDTLTRSATGHEEMADLRVPGLTILGHPDVRRIGERSALTALVSGRDVALSRLEPVFAAPGASRRRPLADPHLSRRPLHLVPTSEGVAQLVTTGTKTRVEAEGEPVTEMRTFSAEEMEKGVVLLLADRVALLLHYMDPLPPQDVPRFGLVGESASMMAIRQQIARAAEVEHSVLLRGETGTGKELVAGAIHEASPRAGRPWVPVNMGAIPPSLAAAELFGAAKGAFTGADRRRLGYFAQAGGGTLFLDEIGETPAEIQALLLRTLETRVIQPVGSETSEKVDVRIVAATDSHLENEIEAGRFREPLLHRLSGFQIRLPPLRQRRDDIGLLLLHFLKLELKPLGELWRIDDRDAARRDPWIPASLVARLTVYPWPGNVRQLRNVARQLVIHNRGEPRLRVTAQIEELLEIPSVPLEPFDSSGQLADRLVKEAGDRAVLRTLLFTDLVGSTKLIERLGDQRALEIMTRHDRTARALLAGYGGHEIDKSDGFLMLFDRPADAVAFALAFHEALGDLSQDLGVELETRVGIHLGEIFLRRNNPAEIARGAKPLEVEGLAKPMASRLMSLAAAGQTLLTRHVFDLAQHAAQRDGLKLSNFEVHWMRHGEYRFKGVREVVEVFEVGVENRAPLRAPGESAKAHPSGSSPEPENEKGQVIKAPRKKYRSPTEVNEEELLSQLRRHDFRLQPTAVALGVSRTSLYALIEKSDRIRKPRDLSREEIENCSERASGDLDAMAADLEVSRKGLHRRMTELGLKGR